MPFYEAADGTRLHYTDSGGRARPLLLIHGWCGRLEHWEPQARSLRRDHRVIRVDLRGHGRSQAPQTRYDRDEFAHDVARLMERLRLRDAVVVGHSMGGMIAPEVARLEAERTAGLVVVDTGLTWRLEGRSILDPDVAMRQFDGDDWQASISANLMSQVGTRGRSRPDLAARIGRDAARRPRHVAASAMRHTVLPAMPRPSWSRLKMGVLYIPQSRGADTIEGVRRVFPRAELGRPVGSGHWPQLEVPDQFNAMLRDFVERLP